MIEKLIFDFNSLIQESRRTKLGNNLIVEFNLLPSGLLELTKLAPGEYFQGDIPTLPCKLDKTLVIVKQETRLHLYSAKRFNKLLDRKKFKLY